MNARFVRIRLAAALTGYTEKAIRRKIETGVWIEGQHFKRAPDSNILIDMEAYDKWVAGQQQAGSKSEAPACESRSHGRAASTAKPSRQTA